MQLTEPTSTKTKDRSIDAEWVLAHDDNDGLPVTVIAQFGTQHSSNGKCFFSTLRNLTRRAERVGEHSYTTESTMLFDFVKVGTPIPCARFSTKALAAAHHTHLQDLAAMADEDNADVLAVFAATLSDVLD